MTLSRFSLVLTTFCIIISTAAIAQNQPIGSWRSFVSYSSAIGVASGGNTVLAITDKAFFSLNTLNSQLDAYSKVQGMSDVGMKCIGYDIATSTAVLAYSNGNIDLFKDNTFYNVPELKIKTVAGSKEVFSVYTLNGNAYLSTSLGVVVIDLDKQSIKESYEFNVDNQVMAVKGIWLKGDSLYAITKAGLYRASKNSNELQNFQIWETVNSATDFTSIAGYDDELFVANEKTVYRIVNADTVSIYSTNIAIQHLDAGNGRLFISEYDSARFRGAVRMYTTTAGIYDSIPLRENRPMQVTETLDGSIFIADAFGGMLKQYSDKSLGYVTPSGPIHSNSYDIYAYNKDVWIAHGSFDDGFEPAKNPAGISNFRDEKWKYYSSGRFHPFDTLTDFSVFLRDEKTGIMYAGSFKDGLVVINPDESTQLYTPENAFDRSISLNAWNAQVAGLGLDSWGNLWVSTMFSPIHQLYVKTPENVWTKFSIPGAEFGGPLVVDDNDQIWFVGYLGGGQTGGVSVYNFNGTPADKSDDFSYHLTTGKGYGNLPSNNVSCIAKDVNNNIWVGTANGIGIISNCYSPFDQSVPCDAEIPVVQYDQYAGYLFADNNVRAIAVDGANRKWVGTDDGVWLLSADASKIVSRFTVDNSPLPSNRIQKITVDKVTGDVYIGTDLGLVSYRGTATDGGKTNDNIKSFPNPVPSGYTGTVAIKGLVANADVRITDISGQLVYRTKALGGQAVWNGLDYTGRRPQSGVYLIFASDNNGEETYTGKLVLLN